MDTVAVADSDINFRILFVFVLNAVTVVIEFPDILLMRRTVPFRYIIHAYAQQTHAATRRAFDAISNQIQSLNVQIILRQSPQKKCTRTHSPTQIASDSEISR